MTPARFTVVFQDRPRTQVAPVGRRLAHLIKFAGRYLGLKCVSVVEQTAEPAGAALGVESVEDTE